MKEKKEIIRFKLTEMCLLHGETLSNDYVKEILGEKYGILEEDILEVDKIVRHPVDIAVKYNNELWFIDVKSIKKIDGTISIIISIPDVWPASMKYVREKTREYLKQKAPQCTLNIFLLPVWRDTKDVHGIPMHLLVGIEPFLDGWEDNVPYTPEKWEKRISPNKELQRGLNEIKKFIDEHYKK